MKLIGTCSMKTLCLLAGRKENCIKGTDLRFSSLALNQAGQVYPVSTS
jgi:hypothetical protein